MNIQRNYRLYILAIFISIAVGFLTLGFEALMQIFYVRNISQQPLFINLSLVSVVTLSVFIISAVDIYLVKYNGKRVYKGKRVKLFISLITTFIILLIGFLMIRIFGMMILDRGTTKFDIISSIDVFHNINIMYITLFIIVVLLANSLIYFVIVSGNNILTKQEVELEISKLKIENMEVQYMQLKQQINPHFLFNSLNTLNALINGNKKAELFVKRLSDFLRTSLLLNKEKIITLSEELNFCINYLELQKTRFGDALQYSIMIPDEKWSYYIPVFSLQILVENAIKHNVLTPSYPLHIDIEYKNNNNLSVSNNLKIKKTSEKSSSTGLVNLSERYKLISGDAINIETTNNRFTVTIKLLGNEYRNH